MNNIEKKVSIISLMIILILFFVARSIYIYNAKKERIYVGGINTTFSEILSEKDRLYSKYEGYMKWAEETGTNDEYLHFLNILYSSPIIGIDPKDARALNYTVQFPFFVDNVDDGRYRTWTLSSCTNPIIYKIEFYEFKGSIYLKVWYSTDNYYEGYTAVYKFAENVKQELLDAYALAKDKGKFEIQ
jgi:hypothetical protein